LKVQKQAEHQLEDRLNDQFVKDATLICAFPAIHVATTETKKK
jgi:hypothetical protein